jgi:hypothetical protein
MDLSLFNSLADETKIADTARQAAKRVLVDGLKKAVVAREVGLHRNTVGDAVKRIEARFKVRQGAPDGWHVVCVCVPLSGVEPINELAKQYQETP